MEKPKQHLGYPRHFLLLFLLLQGTPEIFSEDCQLYHGGTILDCVELNAFPNSSYNTVKMIKFSKNNLTELKPYIFANHSFYNLEKAILRHSYIQYIHPNAFDSMSQLTYLDLHGNNITLLTKETFSGLGLLKHLQLGQNQILLINETILKPLISLESLDLTFNRIHNLSSDLFKNRSILELKLSGNPILFSKQGPIFQSYSLLKLALRKCNLKEIPQDSFKMLPELIYLDISENFLKILPDNLLSPLVGLQSLDLRSNSIKNLDIEKLPLNSHINVLLCGKNPLEEIKSCSTILDKVKSRKSRDTKNTSVESLITDQNKPLDKKQMLKSSLVENKTNNNREYRIDIFQYRCLIGLSITLIVLVVILSLQALYIVKQSKRKNKNARNRLERLVL